MDRMLSTILYFAVFFGIYAAIIHPVCHCIFVATSKISKYVWLIAAVHILWLSTSFYIGNIIFKL